VPTLIRRFLRVPAGNRWLLLGTFTLLSLIRIGLVLLPFQVTYRLLSRLPVRLDAMPPARAAWAVTAAARYVPGASCLVRALGTQALLAGAGERACVCVGIAKGESARLHAHAWVESGGAVVGPEDLPRERYTVLMSLGAPATGDGPA
jgi:hypothetical protein